MRKCIRWIGWVLLALGLSAASAAQTPPAGQPAPNAVEQAKVTLASDPAGALAQLQAIASDPANPLRFYAGLALIAAYNAAKPFD